MIKMESFYLITDHLDWKEEYKHLTILQDKINAYVSFLEERQHVEIYPSESIKYGIIEIHFLYDLSCNAEKYIHAVNNQLNELGIEIRYYISKEEWYEVRQRINCTPDSGHHFLNILIIRLSNLPEGTNQSVLIDIRGQNVSQDNISTLYNNIMERTNNGIKVRFKTN